MILSYIVLASGSLWRRRLLKKHGIKCKVHVSDFEEIKKHATPKTLALHNACGKAHAVAKHYKKGIIIGVDTVVFLNSKVIGKPRSRSHAKKMLLELCGKTHRVISGLCAIDAKTGKKYTDAVETKVTFRRFSEKELEKYLDSNHWKGKAGSYAIQGRAKGFVEKIHGDVTNIVGLPVEALRKILRKFQISSIK